MYYYSSSVSKCLILVLFLAIQLILISNVMSLNMTNAYLNHKCLVSEGKYEPGTIPDLMYRDMFFVMASSIQGFQGYVPYQGGIDIDPMESGILQCRGDSYGPKCRDCFATALAAFRRICPKYKAGIIWYDHCLFAMSSRRGFIGKVDKENIFCMSNSKRVDKDKVQEKIAFRETVEKFIAELAAIAARVTNRSDPEVLYAAGEKRFKKTKLYGMVQCTQDISGKACHECVLSNMLHFQDCLREKLGWRVLGKSCNLRFELYPFVYKIGPRYLKG